MRRSWSSALLSLLLSGATAPVGALSLQFDYSLDTAGFFTPERRGVLEAAGDYFSALLSDGLTAITPGGVNQFTGVITHPGTLAQFTLPGLSVPADTLVVYAGGNPTLGPGTLGFGGPGGFQISGTPAFIANARSRGEDGATTGAAATEFAPWGGMLVLNSSLSWYADDDVSTVEAFAGHDLYSVVLHELGHVLGLGTAASWFRLVSGTLFTGAAAIAAYGNAVPLEADGAHWAEGTASGGQEAAMDPSLLVGSRKPFTALDVAALDDIGWEVRVDPPSPDPEPVPLPLPALAVLAVACVLGAARVTRARC